MRKVTPAEFRDLMKVGAHAMDDQPIVNRATVTLQAVTHQRTV